MGIVDNFKDLFKVAESVNNLDLYKKLSELQTRVMELEEENRSLKEELRKAKEQQNIAGALHVEGNSYLLGNDGPFCMRCWDADRKLIREKRIEATGAHFCPECALRLH